MSTYDEVLSGLEEALRLGHRRQVELVGATERAYAFLEDSAADLTDQETLALRMALAQAETQIGRYFGM